MKIKSDETVTITTKTYGDVKIENHKDKALHFYWTRSGRKENGFFLIQNGEVVSVSNVPQNLWNEVGEAL